jgi:hypothetical protein
MTNTTITLNQFHDLLADAYAVCVNDTLYFVGYDTDDNPYIADNDGQDYVDLSSVDGDIEVDAEDELADVVSDETGWCVKYISYELVNN